VRSQAAPTAVRSTRHIIQRAAADIAISSQNVAEPTSANDLGRFVMSKGANHLTWAYATVETMPIVTPMKSDTDLAACNGCRKNFSIPGQPAQIKHIKLRKN
jgi:hypothetical protein